MKVLKLSDSDSDSNALGFCQHRWTMKDLRITCRPPVCQSTLKKHKYPSMKEDQKLKILRNTCVTLV